MRKLITILILLFTVSTFGQNQLEKKTFSPSDKYAAASAIGVIQPDSTLFKKYFADIKTLQESAQKLDKDKYEFLGKYFESMQSIQNQFQVVNMYLEQEKKKLAETKDGIKK